MAWEEYQDIIWMFRDGVRKAKMQVELNLKRDVKNYKKGLFKYIGQKRQAKESVPPLINEKGMLARPSASSAPVAAPSGPPLPEQDSKRRPSS